jgi:peptidyl-prolyl cis-trans isomerase D
MKQFSDSAEQLDNLAFEQGDSLQPAADALKLTIQHSDWISRTGSNDKLFSNAKLLQAVFSDDVLKNKRNTEVVDVGGNTLVVARVADYRPASTRPFAEVSAGIEQSLAHQQATQLAAQQGQELLERLKRGDSVAIDWSPSRLVSRNAVPIDSPGILQEIFRMDVGTLPAYGGAVDPQNGGYVLLKISSVTPGDADSAKLDSIKSQLQQIMGQEESNAYIMALKSIIDVQINQKQFEQKQQ